jgi:hypothetical protein
LTPNPSKSLGPKCRIDPPPSGQSIAFAVLGGVKMSGTKRRADLPKATVAIQEAVSKSDLMEVAWDLASLCNDGNGCDDDDATRRKLVEFLNARRIARGAKPFNM